LQKELYILKPQILDLCALAKKEDFELWRKRLGHHSCKILNRPFDVSFEKYIECDVYKLAKLTKSSFGLSLSKSNASFELIHFDI
jgi:hypothetical protein